MEVPELGLMQDCDDAAVTPPRPGRTRRAAKLIGGILGAALAVASLVAAVTKLHVTTDTAEERGDLLIRYEALKSDHARLLGERDELANTKSALQGDVDAVRESKVALASQVEDLEAARDALQRAIEDLRHRLEAESARVDAERRRADSEAARAEALQAELDHSRAACDALQRTNGNLDMRLYAESARAEALQGEVAQLRQILHTPASGWAIFGEPCHSEDGHGGRHPRMHNRNFDPDVRPTADQGATVFVVRELTAVWSSQPIESTRDRYSVPFVYNEGEWYPPEETSGVLVPGQRVAILRTFPIKYGPTFVEYRLL